MEFFDGWYQFILAQYFIIMMDCAKTGVSEIELAHPSYRQTKNSG